MPKKLLDLIHPGEILLVEFMKPLGVSINKLARDTDVPTAMLSRAVVGVRGKTLIVNLPGSPAGARENLEAILSVLPHAIGKIRGDGGDCAT